MGRPKNDARRRELLAACIRYAQERGLFSLTLRPLADELGTSTRNLLHYFGTREDLILEIIDAVVAEQLDDSRALLSRIRTSGPETTDPSPAVVADVIADGLELSWAHTTSAEGRTRMAMFFEIYAAAMRDKDLQARFVDPVIDEWVAPMTQALEQAGVTNALSLAHRVLAVHRGLLLEATTTGLSPEIAAAHAEAVDRVRNEIRGT